MWESKRIILKGIIIKLDYIVSKGTVNNVYIYIQSGVGERQVYNFV